MMMSRSELESKLVAEIAQTLAQDIEHKGRATLLVSGGSTPLNLFKLLSNADIEWSKVTVSLVDERFVPDGHKDQNGELVKANLLQNKALKAQFIPLVQNAEDATSNLDQVRSSFSSNHFPLSVVILGMGTDGHTASLFPAAPELDEGMDLNQSEWLMITNPKVAPHQRITFTRKALLNTNRLILHCYGQEKALILKEAEQKLDYHIYPIAAFMGQDMIDLEVYWTE
jgi:6-phosphogluconolactonase